MSQPSIKYLFFSFLIATFLFPSCQKEKKMPTFHLHEGLQKGIQFQNTLTPTKEINILDYMYFFNGGGIAAGDFNKDGLIDLYFSGNQVSNQLYINQSDLTFKDVTKIAFENEPNGWSTGATVIDINNDGMLDLYVCEVGNYKTLQGHNRLYVCQEIKNGIPIYKEQAKEYGLAFSGFSTQASFLDYDLDGDLDMYLLNHSVHANGTMGRRSDFLDKQHPLSGDRFYKNENGIFVDHTKEAGIYSNQLGYGLGIAVSDINLDGYPDIYIGNDFHENDYLYINQKDGTFKEQLQDQIMHTSRFSMGVDIADLNNDGFNEIMTLDMLPFDPILLKRAEGEDAAGTFKYKLKFGYNHQYVQNCLQLNNGNGTFSEIAMQAEVHATDWSWATLFFDFENDGYKDIFVSNGIPKRMNDIDFINFLNTNPLSPTSDIGEANSKNLQLIAAIPEVKIKNQFFSNQENLGFENITTSLTTHKNSYSNGAIYADLDGDNDLDIVSNNIDDPIHIYENKTANTNKTLNIKLIGHDKNIHAIGTKIFVYTKNGQKIYYEKTMSRGFQSSMEMEAIIGIGQQEIEKVVIVWPDNTWQETTHLDTLSLVYTYQEGLPTFDYQQLNRKYAATITAIDYGEQINLNVAHEENPFVEFDRESLIPHTVAEEGPALAVGDLNNDGREDFFLGGAKGKVAQIMFQNKAGAFEKRSIAAIEKDKQYEDTDALILDVDGDGDNDLLVASGGNEYKLTSPYTQPRLYRNMNNDTFQKDLTAFKEVNCVAQIICPNDIDGDGDIDLFIGARSIPWRYGETPTSYLLVNNGQGIFSPITEKLAPDLSKVGLVKFAEWVDLDKNGEQDLVLALEWGEIVAFMAVKGKFNKEILFSGKGWWNCILSYDFDNDGDIDLLAGNQGTNHKLKIKKGQTIKMYLNDFDNNGQQEPILNYYVQDKEIPFATKMDLEKQLPYLKKKYLFAKDFAQASTTQLLGKQKLKTATLKEADFFESILLENDGQQHFKAIQLPATAQISPLKTAQLIDANKDTLMDIIVGGNFYGNNVQMGRYDGNFGSVLMNKGNGHFESEPLNGLTIKGQIRKIEKIKVDNKEFLLIARNNEDLKLIEFKDR